MQLDEWVFLEQNQRFTVSSIGGISVSMKKGVSLKKGENCFLVFLFLVGAFLFARCYNVPIFLREAVSPGLYARTVCGMLIFGCALKLTLNFIQFKRDKTKGSKNKNEAISIPHPKLIIFQASAMILYVFGMVRIGFFITTFCYVLISLIVFSAGLRTSAKKRRLLTGYVLGSAGFTAVLYFLFNMLNIFLPRAMLF